MKMGAGSSVSLCQSQSSVRVLKHSARVEPEPHTPDTEFRAVFGVPLSKLRDTGRLQHGVPVVLKNMVEFLEKYGLKQSGVFRVCGSASRCKMLRLCLDRGEPLDLVRGDVPTVASLLKLFLRELPCGLIPNTHSKRMQQALTECKDQAELFEALKKTLNHLPDDNYNILSYLLSFLSRVAAHNQWNHMTFDNLARVFGPCIFRVCEGPRMLEEQTVCNTLTLHLLEKHADLMPNTPNSDLPLPSPPLTDTDKTRLHLDQSCKLGAVCDTSMDDSQPTNHIKDTNIKVVQPTAAQMQTLTSSDLTLSSNSDKTEVEKRRQDEERQTKAKLPSPNHNNNNTHSHSCHTLTSYSNTHSQSGRTHATETSNSTTGHAHPKTRTKYIRSHTYTLNRDKQTKITCHTHSRSSNTLPETISTDSQRKHTHSLYSSTDSQSGGGTPSNTSNSTGHTHSRTKTKYVRSHTYTPVRDAHTKTICHTHARSSDTHPEISSAHSQNNHTHSTESFDTRTEDRNAQESKANPSSSCEQPIQGSWGPISSQNLQLSSEQDSVSNSQSHVMSDCISNGNSADDSAEQSVSLLQHRVHSLQQAVKSWSDSFHYEDGDDEVADPKVEGLMMDLDKACKQIKNLQSRQCVDGSKKLCSSFTVQQGVGVPLNKPALEDTVKTLTQHLKEKRLQLNLPEHVQDMTLVQLGLEKMTLQKSLLYYESLHGRPRSKEERSVMRDLYNRYRLVKQAFYSSNTHANTMTEDKGLDELIQQTHCNTVSVPTQEASNPAFISRLDEVKLTTAPTNNTHSVNRTEILKQLRETRVEKKRLRKILKEYEKTVLLKTGRSAQREDLVPMAAEYDRYKTLKARLKLLKRMLGQTHAMKASG